MRVADSEPQARLARRAVDHRPRIRKARPRAHPGLVVDALAERKQLARLGISRSNCTGVGGASRGANSAPVVMRMPCSIGVRL